MAKFNLLAAIAAAFVANPKADKLLVTPDGNCFLEENKNAAQYHARVTGTKLTTYERKDFETAPEDDNKHELTQEDLDANPDLLAQGLKVGDKVELPAEGKKKRAAAKKAE